MARPLEGLRVLDLSLGAAGPQATGLLADYGADVIWIEPPGGDPFRKSDPGAASVYNRGKRSICLDLAAATDRDTAARLADWADVLVTTQSRTELAALGIDLDALRARRPGLIIALVTGFAADDADPGIAPCEPLVHAVTGSMHWQAGHREGPIFIGLPFAALGAAQLAALGILSSLYRRLADGHGRLVETSLVDGALAFLSMTWGESDAELARGPAMADIRAMTKAATRRLITRSFVCADGEYIGIHTAAVGAFDRLMKTLGLDDRIRPITSGNDLGTPLTTDEAEYIESRIHDIFAEHPRAVWVERLLKADVCAVEHHQPTKVFDEPQVKHNQMVVSVEDPVLGPVEQVAPGILFDGASCAGVLRAAPQAGSDGAAILALSKSAVAASPWSTSAGEPHDPSAAPLAGVKVADFGAFYAGPFSSRLLADLGADVIKIEPTVGDQLRGIERPFFSAQAGKRSLAANLKEAALRPALEKLVAWADVLHHNMRPGVAERLGIGAEQVRSVNPKLIYLYAPGWGATGPHALRQSFAPMLAGFVGGSFEVAGQFNEPMPSLGNEDPGNGLLGAIAMLIALVARRQSGAVVSCLNPQLNAAMGLMAHVVRTRDGEAVGAGRLDTLQMGIDALESLYQTSDGWLCLVACSDEDIRRVEQALGVRILSDARFSTVAGRQNHRDELSAILMEAFSALSTADALAALSGATKIALEPAGPEAKSLLFRDPAHRRVGRVAEVHHPDKGNVREIAKLVRISGAGVAPHRAAPRLGEHTRDILAWLGYAPAEIDKLANEGVIKVL
ncbi:MAG: CoA transferase [Caulobacterales bacterium]